MSLVIGNGCFPCIIDIYKVLDAFKYTAHPTLSIWEKIKEFFCRTHQTEAMSYLHKLCHPDPATTQAETKALFRKLTLLAHPGFTGSFLTTEYNGILNLRITNAEGGNLLKIRILNDYYVQWNDSVDHFYSLGQSD